LNGCGPQINTDVHRSKKMGGDFTKKFTRRPKKKAKVNFFSLSPAHLRGREF